MKRDLNELQRRTFDIVVVGGGIYGACIARDAAYRGLSVALVERDDFGHATSHNSLRLIHGGLRYLQHLDFPRIRQSIGEQNFWLRVAPHQVRPLRFVMPTYGIGTRGPAALWAGIRLYGLLALDRNTGLGDESRLPGGGLVTRKTLDSHVPGLASDDVNGGAYWYDAQMLDPDRLQVELLQDACDQGACIANYVEATGFLRQGDSITGIRARDTIGASDLEVRGHMTICATGPWTDMLLGNARRAAEPVVPALAKGMNIVTRPLGPEIAFGARSARRSDAVVGQSRRMYFATPAPGCTIIGTSHFPFSGSPDACEYTEQDVSEFLDEFNAAYPPAGLGMGDVYYWHGGLTPAEEADGDDVVRGHHAELVDHATTDGLNGLISVVGVKYTTSRLVAEHTVDLVFRKNGRKPPPCKARETPLPGAHTGTPDPDFPTYGAYAERVRRLVPDDEDHGTAMFVAACQYALQHEMAVRLDDLLLRRTIDARRGTLSAALVDRAAELFARHHGLDEPAKHAEIARANKQLAERGVRLAG